MHYTSELRTELYQHVGSDRAICDAARVSTLGDVADEAVRTISQDAGLISYLVKNKHGSPFEHGLITFVVTAPIFVFWDHVRHRAGVSFNIESSRYRELQPRFFMADEARTQEGKPGHYVMSSGTLEQTRIMQESTRMACEAAWDEYRARLACGIAREQAMEVLPMNTIISAYVSFNPRSLMKFLELRLGPARAELQSLARAYLDIAGEYWPHTFAAFHDAGRVAP